MQPNATMPATLRGPRVLLRGYDVSDFIALHATILSAHEHLARWLPGFEQIPSLDAIGNTIREGHARWSRREAFSMGIFTTTDGTLLGDLRLRPTDWSIPAFDIACWLRPDAEGQGYAGEAVRLAGACAFEQLGAQRLAIACDPNNERSARVAKRLGFVLEGRLRNSALGPDGHPCDLLVYALTPEDYERLKPAWGTIIP
jgi:ribosomal-protein-serine acetyltransferase